MYKKLRIIDVSALALDGKIGQTTDRLDRTEMLARYAKTDGAPTCVAQVWSDYCRSVRIDI